MLEPIAMTTIFGLALGYILGRIERHLQTTNHRPPTTDHNSVDQVARRVWPKLQDWRDRELSEALAHPDETRKQLITRIWRRRVGLRPDEPTPVEVEQHIRSIIDCPWPERED